MEEITVHVCVLPSFQTFMLKEGCCICIQSESPLNPPVALSPLSAVYIKSTSRSRCQPIKYIHFPGFYSAAHLLNIYEWRPLNSLQFTFKAGFIGTTDVQQLIVQWAPTPLHLLHKRDFVNATKLFRQSTSHAAG